MGGGFYRSQELPFFSKEDHIHQGMMYDVQRFIDWSRRPIDILNEMGSYAAYQRAAIPHIERNGQLVCILNGTAAALHINGRHIKWHTDGNSIWTAYWTA